MWNQPKEHNAFLITINPRTITCSYLSQSNQTHTISLKSYNTLKFDNLELENLIIFNPTTLSRYIANTYQPYAHKNTPVLLALNGPSLYTKILSTPNAHPTLEQFPISHAPHWLWEYSYLYSHNHRHYFYVCGMQRTLLLQYQLLSITTHLPMHTITTEYMALLQIYRYMFGSAFRHSQLGEALLEQNNTIEQLFTADDLHRLLSIPSDQTIQDTDHIPLLTACGLLVSLKDCKK